MNELNMCSVICHCDRCIHNADSTYHVDYGFPSDKACMLKEIHIDSNGKCTDMEEMEV